MSSSVERCGLTTWAARRGRRRWRGRWRRGCGGQWGDRLVMSRWWMGSTSKNRVRRTSGETVPVRGHPVSELGWSREKAARVRASLRAFDEDWNAPGMEEYDRL